MKKWEDLSIEEKASVSYEDFDKYCLLACAEAGVPIPPDDPGPCPTPLDIKPTTTAYIVNGELYLSEKEAIDVATAMNKATRYYQYNSMPGVPGFYYLGETRAFVDVKPTLIFTNEEYHRYKKEAEEIDQRIKDWDKEKKVYNDAKRRMRDAIEWLKEEKEAASLIMQTRKKAKDDFETYLRISDGNREMAIKFFVKIFGFPDEPTQKFLEIEEKELYRTT